METRFDIAVIGSGPGGYTAAIRASQLGYKVAIIEKYPVLGGTCTNVGCIPSKALLDSTEHYYNTLHNSKAHGVVLPSVQLDFGQLIARKDEVVRQNNSGLKFLMNKNKIEVFTGHATFTAKNGITIKGNNGTTTLLSDKFIIATGSKPSELPGCNFDKARIISSTEALSLPGKPGSMVIIGGGVIGVEMASIFSRIGTEVTIIEYSSSLIPNMDRELGKELHRILSRKGVKIMLNSRVQKAVNTGKKAEVTYLDRDNNTTVTDAEYCLVAVGRKPYTEGLGLENIGVQADAKGFIKVNELLQTNIDNIYAIGDVIGGAMLAHKAEDEGVFVAERINGQKPHIRYHLIPNVVYTWPEVASSGYTEEYLEQNNIPYRVGKFPFSASGRARAAMEKDGFVKVLTEPKYGEVLGVHIIGPRAADMIMAAIVGMEYEVTDEDMYRISYPHPTYTEALKEAFLISSGQGALNI